MKGLLLADQAYLLMRLLFASLSALVLTACGGGVVVKDRVVEVKIPVSAPCRLGEQPFEPVILSQKLSGDQWRNLTTDQREHLIVAQALKRKTHGEQLEVNTAGCR